PRPRPGGARIALTASTPASGGRGQAPLGDSGSGIYIVDVESGQLTRVPPAPAAAAEEGVVTPGGPPAAGLGSGMAFARDGRTLYFRARNNLFAAPINLNAATSGAGSAPPAAAGGRGGRGGRGGAPAESDGA